MKVAVCVSGLCNSIRGDKGLRINDDIRKEKFSSADFYYATYDHQKEIFDRMFPNENCVFFPEPTMHYHPYKIPKENHISSFYEQTMGFMAKGGGKRMNWSQHHTKQILIHSWLISSLKQKYDVIVRTRFDGFIHKNADFIPYIEDTFRNQRANCFGATHKIKFHQLRQINPQKKESSWADRLLDQLIIYNADKWDCSLVEKLHNERLLHAAEYGWWQIISKPHGSNHRNHSGWVNHDKNILEEYLSGKK